MASFQSTPLKVTPTFAHNLIYGAGDYAAEFGFFPHKNFAFAENVLDDSFIDDGIDEIEFGHNGIPHYFRGPNDNAKQIIAHLNRVLGEGNFHYTAIAED